MQKLESMNKFEEVINDGLSVVMFSAKWCPDCVVIEPILPEIESKFTDFTFYYADRDALIDLCVEQGIFGIPSFVVYNNGLEVSRFVSKDRKTQEEIEVFLKEALTSI